MLVHEMGHLVSGQKRSKDFLEFERQEKRKDDAVLRRTAVAPTSLSREVKLADLNFSALWSLPVPSLQKIYDNPAKRPGLYWNIQLRLEGSPKTTQSGEDAQREFARFVDSLSARTGMKLGVGGMKRFELFVCSQLSAGIEATQDTLSLAFNKLVETECFSSLELSHDESLIAAPEPEPDHQPTQADLEKIDTSTPEGRQSANYIANWLYQSQAAPIASAWIDSLAVNFGGFTLSPEDLKMATQWFHANNKSWLDVRNYDSFRLYMCRTGRWEVPRLFTDEDIRTRAVERLDLSNRDIAPIVRFGKRQEVLDILARHGVSLI